MAHLTFICPPYVSHIRVFEALGEELVGRGHRASFFLNAGGGKFVGAPWMGVEEATAAPGAAGADSALMNARRPGGILGALRTIRDSAALTDQLCASGPDILARLGTDAIVGDQLEPAAGLLAAHLRLPHVSLACALPINPAPGVPLPFLDWPFDPSAKGIRKARGGDRVAKLLMRRHYRIIAHWAERFAIGPRNTLVDCLSSNTQIAQISRGFDFPRPEPIPFEAVGPIRGARDEGAGAPLPFEPDGKRPLVFATMGTLQGGRVRVFRAIARACRASGAELVVAHGGLLDQSQASSIGADHIFDFVPQRAVLERAALCISHAGLNTILDCLGAGVPMIVRPIAFDQKGTTARILAAGIGERMAPLGDQAALASQVRRMIDTPAYRQRLQPLSAELLAAGGAKRAADIVESAIIGQGR